MTDFKLWKKVILYDIMMPCTKSNFTIKPFVVIRSDKLWKNKNTGAALF